MICDVPILREVDVLVLGGSTGAVETALAARQAGRRVFLATPYTYLGDDICAHMRYWPVDSSPATGLAQRIFGSAPSTEPLISPMRVKHTAEQALLEADVEFLYGVYPVAAMRDEAGRVAGAVVANRSGFQAIRAGVVVDATERALFAKLLPEAEFAEWPAGPVPLRRVTVGEPDDSLPGTKLPGYFETGDRKLEAVACETSRDLTGATPSAIANADVASRLESWHPGQLLSSDRATILWPDRLTRTGHRQENWPGSEQVDLACLSVGSGNVFVLSAMADLSDEVAQELQKPMQLMSLGARLGQHIGKLPEQISTQVRIDQDRWEKIEHVDLCRRDRYFRLADAETLPLDLNRLPVLGEVDVLVTGGGTGGAPAGIAAARAGAKTLIVEYTSSLGGVGTEGRIATYWHGNRVGFTAEIDQGLQQLGPEPEFTIAEGKWNTEWKKHWYLRTAYEAGAQVWFGAMVVAVAMKDKTARGAVVVTPYGYGLVRAKALVDSTGNGDVAAAAGADTVNISKAHVAVQGSGLAPVDPKQHYTNTDYTFVDDTDVVDVTRTFAVARQKFRDWFDLAQLVDSRQRQQIRGEFSLDPVDFLARRTYPDTITTAESNFDSHGFTIHPLFMAKAPDKRPIRAHVPFRCLLPRGIEGMLVTGLGVSAHRDALPVVRMQADVQNQGYAAGRAAAMAALEGSSLRGLDIRKLQRHLVETGVLEPEVAMQEDSFPLPEEEIQRAVREGMEDYLGLAVIFSNEEKSLPWLREAYQAESDPESKLRYAHVLGLMGDGTGLDTLLRHLEAQDWDQGWHYTGMGQFGFSLSPVDSMLVAVGRIGDGKAHPVMLRKLESLGFGREFSHYRALVLAFEAMPMKKAAPVFEAMLADVGGHARGSVAAMVQESPADKEDTSERNQQLKELMLARGLMACGDPHGRARNVLEAYRRDLHGHYARHAHALLSAKPADNGEMSG